MWHPQVGISCVGRKNGLPASPLGVQYAHLVTQEGKGVKICPALGATLELQAMMTINQSRGCPQESDMRSSIAMTSGQAWLP